MTTVKKRLHQVSRLFRRRSIQVGTGIVIAALVAGTVLWQRAGLPDGAAYEVGGTVVTEAQLRHDVSTLRALYGVAPPSGERKLDQFWRDSAQATAVSRVLDDAARDQGIVIAQSKIDQGLASYISALYPNAADARNRFVRALGNAGTSEKSVKAEIRRRLTVDKLLDKVTKQATAPSAIELNAAYAKRGCSLVQPETRAISNIVVETRAEAKAIKDDLASGTSFTDLARTRSADQVTKDKGGDLGAVTAQQLDGTYADVAFKAKKGAAFGPVKTDSGWNIGVVTAVTPSAKLAFQSVVQRLSEQMLLERRSELWQDWLTSEVKGAKMRFADDYRPEDPDALPEGIAAWAKTQQGLCSSTEVAP